MNTEDEIFKRTFGNWRWRLNNLYFILDKNGRRIKFKENKLQALINDDPYNFKEVLKSRQIGFSTNYILRQFDYTIWNRNKTCCILAHEQDSIKKLFRIPTRAYKYMDQDLRPEIDRGGGSKYEFYFPGIESRIYVDLESRGDTIHWLHISEAAFIKDVNRIRATMEAVPKDGIITFETTPNGMGNHFYDRWLDHDSRFKKYFFPWFMVEEYVLDTPKLALTAEERTMKAKAKADFGVAVTDGQIAWRRMKKADLKELFPQEYPENDQECFLASGNPALNLKHVKRLYDASPDALEERDGLRIYKRPVKGGLYVIGADPAEGVGGDYSAASVFDIETREQVATLHGQFAPRDFAEQLDKLGKLYASTGAPHPLLCVERNNHGHAVLLWLSDTLRYPNLYFTRKADGTKDKAGFLSDRVTRPLMIDSLIDGIQNDSIKLNCKVTLAECLTLINNNGKIEAAENKHDDSFISAALGLQMILNNKMARYDNIAKQIRV